MNLQNRNSQRIFVLGLLATSLFLAGTKPLPPKRPGSDAGTATARGSGWTAGNEWIVAGNYAEACSDPPLCPGLFGAPSGDATCRKIMLFQITRGRYQNTNLSGLSAFVVAESPKGHPISPGNRDDWTRCDLVVTDQADTAQVKALVITLGALVSGVGGPKFSRVESASIGANFTGSRMAARSPDRLRLLMHAVPSQDGIRPPDLNNLGSTFRFLGPLYVYTADTLSYAGNGASWNYARRSGIVSQFAWNSEVARQEVGATVKSESDSLKRE